MARITSTAARMVAGAALVAAPLAVTAAVATPASAATGTALVTVVHGIPDTPVDVYVDGAKALSDFRFRSVTGSISLPAGKHAVAVRKAGDPATAAAILSADPDLPAGANATIVASLTAGGKPSLVSFVNPTSAVPSGMSRVIVRHTAAAPAVDVLAGGAAVVKGLSNPGEKSLMVPAGTLAVSVAAAGTTKPVIGPVSLALKGGATTVVYAVGSLSAGTLTAVTQSYSNTSGLPSSVSAGSGGGAADTGVGPGTIALIGAGAALVGATAVRARRRDTARA